MKSIGILGGSFNPVHIGHLMLANYISQFTDVDEVWLTLSPLNPLKHGCDVTIPDYQRLEMLNIATKGSGDIAVCDVELSMPKPSYTADTLKRLRNLYPEYQFKLIIGSDNWLIFDNWRNHDEILKGHGVIVYPRPGYPLHDTRHRNVEIVDAPVIDLSSTFIRKSITEGKDMNYFLPNGVYKYIIENNLYKH